MAQRSHNDGDTARFVDAFADAWAHPTPDRLAALLHPDVRLAAPLTRSTTGVAAARAQFEQLLALLPDLRGDVHGWGGTQDLLFIDFTLSATVGRESLRWRAVDRFRLEGDLALERVSYFDPLPVVAALLRHPSLWGKFLKSRLARR